MKQQRDKWAVNCSRSCSKILQHKKNHADKRIEKKCVICKKSFLVVKWNKDQMYCSRKCCSVGRFGTKNKKETLDRLNRILKDEKYLKYIKTIAYKVSFKWGRGEEFVEDLMQEFFLELCKGNNTKMEHVSKVLLRKEIKKGIVGKWTSDFSFIGDESLKYIKESENFLSSYEFVEYISDIFRGLNRFEQKFIMLYIKGFTNYEVMEQIRENYAISNDNFYKEKRRLLEKDYSNYGANYKKYKVY